MHKLTFKCVFLIYMCLSFYTHIFYTSKYKGVFD
jgi:hypothetical protein